ncbi:MAG: hypothetical protein Q4A15_12525 [Prevotellaceae bacterium]|nr:hypothetical protein [Prevotellaceae bacterium]
MSLIFFNSILTALGRRVNYDAISNYAGNSFAKDSWKMIQEANPLTKQKTMNSGFLDMIVKAKTNNKKAFADVDWADV